MKKIHIFILIFIVAFSPILFTKDTSQAASKIQLSNHSLMLELGHYKTIRVYGTSRKAYWYSSNNKVAVVSSNGKVTAKASGNTTITAVVAGKRLTCKVKVFQIHKKNFSLAVGQSHKQIVWGPYYNITWHSSDKSIATVSSSGKVTGRAKGTATITATVDGNKLTSKVTVIDLNYKALVLELGGWSGYVDTLKVKNTSSTITWTSSNKAIATVSRSGLVTARGAGSATITAFVNGAKLTCKVKVLKMSHKDLSLNTGETKTLKIYGTTSKITWHSNYKVVATISDTGIITAKSPGTATITGYVDGIEVTSDITVTD